MKDEEEDKEFFPEFYDEEYVFDEKIQPLLKGIVNICSEYNIPMIAAFQYKNTDDQVMICCSAVLPTPRTCLKLREASKLLLK